MVKLNPHCFDLGLAGEEFPLPVGVPATRRHWVVLITNRGRIGEDIICGLYLTEHNMVNPIRSIAVAVTKSSAEPGEGRHSRSSQAL